MTKQEAVKKVLDIAKSYIGYLEKASKENLDEPKANVGSGNYTKFARDFFPELQGLEWCCMFVYACFAYAYNPIMAQNLLSGTKTAKCSILYEAMKKDNQEILEFHKAEKGDLIFFHKDGRINHIGIISDISNNRIETIEGNTSTGNNVVINSGGGVYQKYYDIANARIYGITRPKWEIIAKDKDKPITFPIEGIVNATNVNVRKDAGTNNPVVCMLDKNAKVKILDEKNDGSGFKWYKIQTNKEGYIRSDFVSV